MKINFTEHTIRDSDRVLLTPALNLCVYFGVLTDEIRSALAIIWSAVFPIYGNHLRWYMTECMPHQEPVNEDVFEMIPFWFEPNRPIRRRYFYYCHGGEHPGSVCPWAVELYIDNPQAIDESQRTLLNAIYGAEAEEVGKQTNCFRLSFPVDSKSFSPDQLLSLTEQVFHTFPLLHGYAGFSLLFDADLNAAGSVPWEHIARIALRHPGYDVFLYHAISRSVFEKVSTVNWLTLLGEQFGEQFCKLDRMALLHSKEIEVLYSGKKVLLKAGPFPEIGDFNRGQNLPLYSEVAEALMPFLCEERWAFSRVFDDEKTMRWIKRFWQ
jgi:hypothetical protein